MYRPHFGDNDNLTFAASAVFQKWLNSNFSDRVSETNFIRILTSKDKSAIKLLMGKAHANRKLLGGKWWRLLQIGILWAALSHLMPRYDDPPEAHTRWDRRLFALRKLKIFDADFSAADINRLVSKVERFEKLKLFREKENALHFRRQHFGIDSSILAETFSWLLEEDNEVKSYDEHDVYFIQELWKLESRVTYGENAETVDRNEDGRTLDEFGYILVEKLAKISSLIPPNEAALIWKPLFELGTKAHYAIGHFLDLWIIQISRADNKPTLILNWKNMIDYALVSDKWNSGRGWIYGEQLLRQMLGMNSQTFLGRADMQEVVLDLKDYYKKWAEKHLNVDEDNIAAFCQFLSSNAGKAIRLDGIVWLKSFITSGSNFERRKNKAGNGLVALLDTTINENSKQIAEDATVREALVSLIAILVAKQVTAALALQERIKRIVC